MSRARLLGSRKSLFVGLVLFGVGLVSTLWLWVVPYKPGIGEVFFVAQLILLLFLYLPGWSMMWARKVFCAGVLALAFAVYLQASAKSSLILTPVVRASMIGYPITLFIGVYIAYKNRGWYKTLLARREARKKQQSTTTAVVVEKRFKRAKKPPTSTPKRSRSKKTRQRASNHRVRGR